MTKRGLPFSGDWPTALILGDDPVNGLGVARNLGRNGVMVHRLGMVDDPLLRSGYIRSTRVVPGLDDSEPGPFVAALRETARRLGGKPVLFPISDLHVLNVSRNEEQLRENFLLSTFGREAIETLVNKRRFHESLAGSDVPHASTRFPRSRDEFVAAAEDIGFPVLLKPEISPLFSRRFRRKGFVADDVEELDRHLETLEASGLAVMIQEIIPGDATCMHGCAGFRNETVTWTCCYRRVREYPPGFGCGSLLESVPSFADQTGLIPYLEHIGYVGIFDAEFKRDPRDGRFKVIEINARSWWQNTLPSASGANIIKAAYDHASGQRVETRDYRPGARWIHLYNDFHAARNAGMGLFDWIRSLQGGASFDIWARDDALPMIMYVSGLALGKLANAAGLRNYG